MGSQSGKSRAKAFFRGALLGVMLLILSTRQKGDQALGQSQAPTQYPPTAGQVNGRPPFGQEPEQNQDPMLLHAQQAAARKRNIERQNKLVADSSRIVELANELSTSVGPSGKDPTSAAMSKKAEEIEKLAKSVRDLMKSE
jgi:hypothetical protein